MFDHLSSPKTALAIGAAMECACASGDLEVAERLFDTYRLLVADLRIPQSAFQFRPSC